MLVKTACNFISEGNKPMKIALLGASFDTCNMGVSALAEASIKCILNRWPDAEVVLLGSGSLIGEHYLKVMNRESRFPVMPLRFCKNIFLPNHFFVLAFYALLLKLFPFRPIRDFLMKHNSYLQLLLQTDLFADITGGDSFSDIYGMRRFMSGFLRKLLPVMFGKDLIMLPQTYGPFKRPLTKFMARYILKRSNIIYSRDRGGAEYVRKLLNDASNKDKVKFVPEVAFVLDPQMPPNMDIGSLPNVRTNKSVVVGLNVSGLLYYGGYTGNNMFGLKEDYGQIVCRIVDFLMAKEDVLILLVPHIFPPIESAEVEVVENDVAACLNVYKRFSAKYTGRIFVVRGSYNQNQIKYIISLCNFFIGSRMHACIAALSQCIPTIGVAYSKKFQGVFESVGLGECVVDACCLGNEDVLKTINTTFKKRQEIRRHLHETIPQVKAKVLHLLWKI
jgi:polysaccharide pyruvyl transferase WcaK-like protein